MKGFLCGLLLLLCGCSRPGALDYTTAIAYAEGVPERGERLLTRRIEKKMPKGRYQNCHDATWLLLDRAYLRLASGRSAEAIVDFRLALEAIDFYSTKPPEERLGEMLLEDSTAAYDVPDFERLLAHIYFALALYQDGDSENATAVLRGAELLQQEYPASFNPFAKYLLAALLERSDPSNAEILYKQIDERPSTGPATLLIINHGGLTPYKVSERCDASVISSHALETILADRCRPPSFSSVTGFKVPQLIPRGPAPRTWVEVDGHRKSLETIFSVTHAAFSDLDQRLPLIAARAAARHISRRGVLAVAEKGKDQTAARLLDIAFFFLNLATEADVRQWGLLPDAIQLVRYDLNPGTHDVRLPTSSTAIDLREGDLCIIQLFSPTPGVTKSLIPQQFISKNGEF